MLNRRAVRRYGLLADPRFKICRLSKMRLIRELGGPT
jgi:hypothetical protein